MAKNVKSVSVIGDSVFKGVMYDSERKRYVVSKDSCQRLLESEVPFKINNYSRFGTTIKEASKVLDYVLQHSIDEIIVIEIGGNDSDFDWSAIAAYPEGEHLPKTTKEEYAKYLEQMVKKVIRAGRIPVLATLPPIDAEKYLDWIVSKGCNRESIMKWLGDIQYIYTFHDSYNEIIINLAKKYNLGLIDLRSGFINENDRELISIDGIHPSNKGHVCIKKIIMDSLKHSTKFYI